MKRVYVLAVTAVLLCNFLIAQTGAQVPPKSSAPPADKYADRLRTFEEFVRQQIEKNNVPGLTIGFIKDDYVWVKAFGFGDLENKTPARADSSYRLASVQKSMTAAAILLLAEQGKIDLDAEIQTYVPYFPKKKWPITVSATAWSFGRNYSLRQP